MSPETSGGTMIRRSAVLTAAVLTAALLIAAPAPSRAGIERAGTTAANFLQIGTGAGTLGMGGATLGLAGGDLGSITWNAASLAHLRETQIAFSHVGLAQSSAQEWAAVAGRMQNVPFRWAFSGLYQGDGSFEGRDALGNPTGNFSASSMAFGANGAYTFMEKVSVGVGVKYVSEALADVHGSGTAIDLGVHVTHGRYGFGAAMQNTAGKMKYEGASYPFGASMGLGVSMTDPATGVRAALDFNVPNAYYPDVRAGVEWMYHNRFALRTGYRYELGAEASEPMTGPTFGMGAGANGFWLDYALLLGGASGDGQHRVGLTFRPGAMNFGSLAGGESAPSPAVSAAPKQGRTETAKSEETRAPKKPQNSKKSKHPVPAPPASAGKPAVSGAPLAAETQKPVTKDAGPIALDTAPPRPLGAKMAETPRSMPAAAKPAQAANTAPANTAPARPAETPKTMPFVIPPPAAPKPAPAVGTPIETPKPAVTKSAEMPKPAEVVAPPVETPKPVAVVMPPVETPKPAEAEATPAPVAQAPKPVETKKPEAAKPAAPRPAQVVVKKGQTLEDIASEWGTSAAAIMMENNLVTSKAPKPGTKLKLPRRSR